MKPRAFTLIELLVVIAIIAILAAILFPVFAQAKDSAKNSALLSNIKQTSTGAIMYGADNDDLFPLSWQRTDPTGQGYWSWQGAIMPYTKNWGVMLNPKLTPPSGDYAYWFRLHHMGQLPRAAAITNAAVLGYYQSNWGITGDANVKSDGVFGGGQGYGYGTAASLSQSEVANIAENVLLTEAGAWDYMIGPYGATNPFVFCGNWVAPYNPWPTIYAGPTTTTRPDLGRTGIQAGGCYYPRGKTTYVATDGSAKVVDFRGRLMELVTLSDGTKAFKRFWPRGN